MRAQSVEPNTTLEPNAQLDCAGKPEATKVSTSPPQATKWANSADLQRQTAKNWWAVINAVLAALYAKTGTWLRDVSVQVGGKLLDGSKTKGDYKALV